MIHDQCCRAAGCRRHGDALTLGRLAAFEQEWRLDEALEMIEPHDPAIRKEGIERARLADHGARVRLRKCLPEIGAAEHIGHDGLACLVRLPRHLRHADGIAHGLEEEQNHVGIGIVDQHGRDLADGQVALIADRDERREADAACLAAADERADHGARLRDETRAALGQTLALEHGVGRERQRPVRIDHAEAVRADEAYAALTRRRNQCRLARLAGFTALRKAAREDGRRRDAGLAAIADGLDDRVRAEHDIGVIRRLGAVGQRGVAGLAEELLVAGVDRINCAGEPVLAQITLRARVVLLHVAGGPDNGNALGAQQAVGEGSGHG